MAYQEARDSKNLREVRAQLAAAAAELPGYGICEFCRCSEAAPCRLVSGDECNFTDSRKRYCNAPRCIKARIHQVDQNRRLAIQKACA
jgi:hypothetical protein